MKKISLFILLLGCICNVLAKSNSDNPKIIVGIVIDQMRADYLHLYQERFGNEGFNQLKGAGTGFSNCYINYLPSYTGPGHACIYTGSVPAIHGIAGNNWMDKKVHAEVYCVQDKTERAVGGIARNGAVSPRNLYCTTITDQLKLANNSKSKTIAISLKDRGAVLPGGHTADAAYWMDDSLGDFMSSTFYMKKLPKWVQNFNSSSQVENYLAKGWKSFYNISTYIFSSLDNEKFIGAYAGQNKPRFPYSFAGQNNSYIKKTPFGNDILFDFAKEAILAENLGHGSKTDFLALSFSSTDYIGHTFSPHSPEIEDCYIRLDIALAHFLKFLDKEYGKDNYLIFLTADHGASYNPNYLIDKRIPAGYLFGDSLKNDLNKFLNNKFDAEGMVTSVNNNQVYFSEFVYTTKRIRIEEVEQTTCDYLLNRSEIQFCTAIRHLNTSVIPSAIKELMINSYSKDRSGEVLFIMKPSYLDAYSFTGTSHGSWNPYDTHIPLIFYGWHIPKNKQIERKVFITDIAPTLANLLQINAPNGSIGQVLLPLDK